jgi:hypothetical protein
MSQSTFGDDDLFDEAAGEMRADVEASLAAAREELPGSEDVWTVDAENTLGVLNTLKGALEPGDAAERLHEAKKWYTIGERADAFEDSADLRDEIEALDAVLADVESAHEHASEFASTVPGLKNALEEAHEAAGEDESTGERSDTEDADAEDADAESTETDAEAEA